LDEALEAMGERPLVVLAGGTDFYPARVGRAIEEDVVDVTAIETLRGIVQEDDAWRIGAATTWTDVIEADLPPLFAGLKRAAREVGGVQIQNAGTVAGNICNASPAADGVPVLLALDASVELRSRRGARGLPLGDFLRGNRKTDRAADELLVAIRVPRRAEGSRSHFVKLGARRYLVISIVSVALRLDVDADSRITGTGIAVGACSAVPQRLPALEAALRGKPLQAGLGDVVQADHLKPLAPIDDVRGSADYRNDAALTLVRRGLEDMARAI
jgi:CO/xanthine dehydrogenase FAD-binding subunit